MVLPPGLAGFPDGQCTRLGVEGRGYAGNLDLLGSPSPVSLNRMKLVVAGVQILEAGSIPVCWSHFYLLTASGSPAAELPDGLCPASGGHWQCGGFAATHGVWGECPPKSP